MSFVDYVGGQSCDSIFTDTSINISPFNYTSNDDNLMILMNCSSDLSLLYHNIGSIPCPGRDSHSKAYYNFSSDVEDDVQKQCNSVAIVPIYQSFVVNLKNSIMDDFMGVLLKGFELSWKLDDMDPSGTCYTNVMGSLSCYCSDGTVSNNGNCVKNITEKKRSWAAIIEVVAGFGGVFLLGMCVVLFLCVRRKRNLLSSKMDPETEETYYNTHIFSYDELEEATHGFHETRKLGNGGFGTVYKGKLRDGRTVAVKRLYENKCRLEQFMNEVEILSCVRHQNLVTLYGCTSRHSRELLLVYEYIPNGKKP